MTAESILFYLIENTVSSGETAVSLDESAQGRVKTLLDRAVTTGRIVEVIDSVYGAIDLLVSYGGSDAGRALAQMVVADERRLCANGVDRDTITAFEERVEELPPPARNLGSDY